MITTATIKKQISESDEQNFDFPTITYYFCATLSKVDYLDPVCSVINGKDLAGHRKAFSFG